MRLIDADELKEWIEAWFDLNKYYHPYSKRETIPTVELFDILDRIPTVDPMKHGRWEEREVIEQEVSNIEDWQSARCSVCGKYHTTPYLYGFNDYPYCPNCGAKMDEVSE